MAEGILNPIPQLEADFDFDVYTKQEVDTLLDGKADKVDTYTKTETDALLNEKADVATTYTKTETNDLLNEKAEKSTTLAGYGITDAYTKTQTDNLLNGKADASDVYTKTETNNLLSVKANSADVYTKTEANNLLSAKADSVNVYTKTESNTLLAGKANVDDVYTKTEIDNQLNVTKDGTWVKGTQTTATNLEKLEGGIEYLYGLLSYKYSQLRKYINGNYYDYETNTDTAYTKTVPAGAMPYAGLEMLGGKTLVWNQLLNLGTITVANAYAVTAGVQVVNGHKYYMSGDITVAEGYSGQINMYTSVSGSGKVVGYISASSPERIFTSSYDATSDGTYSQVDGNLWMYINGTNFPSGSSATNVMLIDLTLLFGAGNEPSTVEEFESMFPAEYYPYNAGELLSAGVTEVVSKKVDNTEIAAYPIPASIQSIEGYGWSAGSVYNYVDFERKVFVQNVGKVVLDGTQTSTTYAISTSQCRVCYAVTNVKSKTTSTVDDEILSDYLPNGNNTQSQAGTPCVFRRENGNSEIFVSLGSIGISAGITDVTGFNAYLTSHPLTVLYPLATPIETDISAYLADDNLIEAEAGGALTFQNQHGDDYRIPVPSTEEYMINLQEAVSNG